MTATKTILFADDDQVLLTAYRKPLESAGYRIVTATDGLVAMKNLFLFAPDLLILDLMMPKFDGEELLQMISNSPQLVKVPVIILSSKCIVKPEHAHLIKLAVKYLIKRDCTPAILLAAVRDQFSDQLQNHSAGNVQQLPRSNEINVSVVES